jgi:hypothetical protein
LPQIFHLTPSPASRSTPVYPPPPNPAPSATPSTQWSITLVNVLSHADPTNPTPAAPITCILPMPHNVYTGDEEGRVVRFAFPYLDNWCSRKEGFVNQVEWKGGRDTAAVAWPARVQRAGRSLSVVSLASEC